MDDYTREMMDLKTLVTRTLEKKGVLAKIRAELRASRLLCALVCEYLEWAQLDHTLKVYQPECNLQKDSWKSELSDFSSNHGYELNRNGDSAPLLLDVLEGFLKFESMTQNMGGNSRRESETESSSSLDSRNPPRRSSASDNLPPLRRTGSGSQGSDRRGGSNYRKDEINWRHGNQDAHEEVMRASAALENLQLDRKTRNMTSSWRNVRDGANEEDGRD
ncbi:hypothetical protein IGI04_027483 [Brassica rapa subsp. trilocularis]|uniref:LisH domain-containing protein n=1 Tax=Brassica rapa subsp. trilocularis TaxID=1813537 RepID=A0ABQ7L300_BRACM|nr:hypothetical protein IGI04_027483 [Brassica rapa subsp. trilocularis]